MAGITFSEASNLNNSIYGKSQAPIRMFVEKKAEAFEQKSMIPELFGVSDSDNFGEKFTSLTAFSGFEPVGENGEYPVDNMQEGPEKFLEHMTWKNSFSISREMVDDSKLLDLKNRPNNFVASYYRTRELFGAAIYAGAVSGQATIKFRGREFSTLAADNKPLFDTSHNAKVKGAAQSNKFSNAFSNAILGAAETRMQGYKGENDEILGVTPDTIVIPNEYKLKNEVFAAIGADKDPNTANNGFNYQFGRWNVIIWPYLNQFLDTSGATVPWMLMDSKYNEEYGGAVWLDRIKLEVKSRIDEGNDANVWQGYSRFIAGFNDWRFISVGGITGGTAL